MSFTVPKIAPEPINDTVEIKKGGFVILGLFLLTITLAVGSHNFLHLPPVLGMMTGLGLLKIYGYRLKRFDMRAMEYSDTSPVIDGLQLNPASDEFQKHFKPQQRPFDIFISMKRAEWDTLMFFYGVILCVGGLGTIGYLGILSESMYIGMGATWANILVGILSAIVDNIPVMFAVLTMQPEISHGQWLLVTLTAGVGGFTAIDWLCSRSGTDGTGPRDIYLLWPSKMELGHCTRLCRQHLDSLSN